VYAGAELRRIVLAVSHQIEHGHLLLGPGIQEGRRVTVKHLLIQPRETAGVDGRQLIVAGGQQVDEFRRSGFERTPGASLGWNNDFGHTAQRGVLARVEALGLVRSRGLAFLYQLMQVLRILRAQHSHTRFGQGEREADIA
jgi:hypothetical protein